MTLAEEVMNYIEELSREINFIKNTVRALNPNHVMGALSTKNNDYKIVVLPRHLRCKVLKYTNDDNRLCYNGIVLHHSIFSRNDWMNLALKIKECEGIYVPKIIRIDGDDYSVTQQ